MEKLSYLADGVILSDFPPTNEQLEVQGKIHGAWSALRDQLAATLSQDVASFNDLLKEQKVQGLLVPRPLTQ